jgi:hypothetical protein
LFASPEPFMFSKDITIASFDPALWAAIQSEQKRQEDHIEAAFSNVQ